MLHSFTRGFTSSDEEIEGMLAHGRQVRCLWVYAPETERCSAMVGIMWKLQRKVRRFHQSAETFWLHNRTIVNRDLVEFQNWRTPVPLPWWHLRVETDSVGCENPIALRHVISFMLGNLYIYIQIFWTWRCTIFGRYTWLFCRRQVLQKKHTIVKRTSNRKNGEFDVGFVWLRHWFSSLLIARWLGPGTTLLEVALDGRPISPWARHSAL